MKTTLRCACAPGATLEPSELEAGLHAHRCARCGGTLLELEDYRRWRAADNTVQGSSVSHTVTAVDSSARHCPNCTRLMHRYRVGARPDFRLDRCAPCQAVWFDAGEWPALTGTGLATRLEEILSDGWQRQVQAEALREGRDAALRQRHGDACIDELERVRQWLQAQPGREELISLLRAD